MSEPTSFLYPFIDAEERDVDLLLADLAASARSKIDESHTLRAATLESCRSVLVAAADGMAQRFAAGGRLFTMGNGGSATDADMTAELFRDGGLPACSLVADRSVLTALANDVGFDKVFSRQLIAYGRAGDAVVGFSTSGASRNVLAAFAEARHRGMLTVAFAGYEGGAMATSTDVAHCLVVRSESVHRIQEAQDALVYDLYQRTRAQLP